MRKLLLYTVLCTLSMVAMAQKPIAEIWTQPAVYKVDEKVALMFDVTGTDLEGITEDIYMWSWFPSEPDAGNWANSSAFAKLTKVKDNVWKLEMVPTEYYKVDASQITGFYGLLKTKNGSKQTDAFAPDKGNAIGVTSISNIQGTATMDYFPKNFKMNRPLSILVNAKNTWSGCETTGKQGELAKATNVHIHSGVNNWATVVENNAANVNKTLLTYLGDSVYRMDMIPEDYFGVKGSTITSIHAVFANADWSLMGKDAACADFYIKAPEVPVVLAPVLSFFPQKISQRDIFYISRKNNEDNVTKLSYEISATGVTTLKGDFEGTKEEFTAYIDLATGLKAASGLAKIHLLIKDNAGNVVVDTDINLVSLQ